MDIVTGVGVIDKAAALLDALARGAPRTLVELGAETGIPRATTHRLLAALVPHGLVRREADGRYGLGLGLVALGTAALDGFPLAVRARPELERLATSTGESAQLFVAETGGRRCAVSIQSPHGLRWIVQEGALLPLGVGSAGRLLDGQPVGREGWIESVEEREHGVASVSAPVHDSRGMVVAAVSVSGPLSRLTRSPGARVGGAVRACAERVGHRLEP